MIGRCVKYQVEATEEWELAVPILEVQLKDYMSNEVDLEWLLWNGKVAAVRRPD